MNQNTIERPRPTLVVVVGLIVAASFSSPRASAADPTIGTRGVLSAELTEDGNAIEMYRSGGTRPLLTQVARPDFRPYLHPIIAPDGNGELTQHSPGHHPHQTGLYWGLTRVNGRDYFHNPGKTHWRRTSLNVLKDRAIGESESVQWQTVYDLLAEDDSIVMRQTQLWTLRDASAGYVLELQWTADAVSDVTLGEYDYGGLFLRMPWRPGMAGRVINSARQRDARAEGQRAVWIDVGIQVDGREDAAHVAIFDHPSNRNFPNAWRVDGQLGVGPALTRSSDWTIDAGKSVAMKFGFLMYGGERSDAEITSRWSDFSGQEAPWAQWDLARDEGRAAEFLTPERAVAEMSVTDGFEVNVYAAEPLITQPMAFCWDDRGRMWVAENRDYENRRTGFSGSGDSRIVILEDRDGDGTADSRKVFAEGIPFPAAMAVGMGGLWLGAPPNLLFVPDADGDDQADRDDVEVRLTGWGILDRHETLNSFHWGPDGWLYGLQGFATPSTVGRPAGGGNVYRPGEPYPETIAFDGETTRINGGVWRYHPTKDRFEVVAHGFSNPWGIDYDRHGQLFITACVIPHLWHVIPGGIYHRQGGTHFNGYVYEDIKTIADHRHRSAHGGARIYQSDAFPPRYHDRIFMANIHEHSVLTDVFEPRGSGFVGRHGDDFLLANNAQWVGFSIEIGPAGNVFVLDWHDADICGSDVLNKETGRIFRVAPVQSEAVDFPERDRDVSKLSDQQLAKLQLSTSDWHARRARIVLQHRAATNTEPKPSIDPSAIASLESILASDRSAAIRLRALWSLHVTDHLDHERLIALLTDDQEYVRGWAIQLLCEDGSPADDILARFAAMAADDPSPVVRLFLASAISRVGESAKWAIASGLVSHAEDTDDHNLPKMIWFGMESSVVADPARAIELASRSRLPRLTRYVARRLSDADRIDELIPALLQWTGEKSAFPSESGKLDSPYRTHAMLVGIRESLEGRFDQPTPNRWSEIVDAVAGLDDASRSVARDLSRQFGSRQIARQMLALVRDDDAAPTDRADAIRMLAAQQHPELRRDLNELFDEAELRIEVIRASANFDDRRLIVKLLDRYDDLGEDERLEVILAMASRSRSGRALTAAIRDGVVPRGDIPAYVARSLQRVVGNGFVEVWGPVESVGVGVRAASAKYRSLLTRDALSGADLGRGHEVFRKACQACHRLFGEGGIVGPDITGANRGNLDYLLSNILTPSAEIQDVYRMQMVLTDEGRAYMGIPAEENDRTLKLRIANQIEPISISKESIQSREVASVSMMPAGILDPLPDSDVIDLFGYLQSRGELDDHGNDDHDAHAPR